MARNRLADLNDDEISSLLNKKVKVEDCLTSGIIDDGVRVEYDLKIVDPAALIQSLLSLGDNIIFNDVDLSEASEDNILNDIRSTINEHVGDKLDGLEAAY